VLELPRRLGKGRPCTRVPWLAVNHGTRTDRKRRWRYAIGTAAAWWGGMIVVEHREFALEIVNWSIASLSGTCQL